MMRLKTIEEMLAEEFETVELRFDLHELLRLMVQVAQAAEIVRRHKECVGEAEDLLHEPVDKLEKWLRSRREYGK